MEHYLEIKKNGAILKPDGTNSVRIINFSYNAKRMDVAPTISASDVMYPICIDDYLDETCYVEFNGEEFHLKKRPTSSKNNTDARYRYSFDFVSGRINIENVYIYDTLTGYADLGTTSESTVFSFFGKVVELAKRINASLIKSGIAKPVLRSGVTSYMTFKEWNDCGNEVGEAANIALYNTYSGSYAAYLLGDVYEVITDGDNVYPKLSGLHVQVPTQSSISSLIQHGYTPNAEKMVAFENNTIKEALDEIKDNYELPYYYDHSAGCYVIGDNSMYIGSNNALKYGHRNSLLSIEKSNTTESVVTRCTGVGSSDNVPYYYPNPTPDGWLRPEYRRENEEEDIRATAITYPTDENSAEFERFCKNRVGESYNFMYGRIFDTISINSEQADIVITDTNSASNSASASIPLTTLVENAGYDAETHMKTFYYKFVRFIKSETSQTRLHSILFDNVRLDMSYLNGGPGSRTRVEWVDVVLYKNPTVESRTEPRYGFNYDETTGQIVATPISGGGRITKDITYSGNADMRTRIYASPDGSLWTNGAPHTGVVNGHIDVELGQFTVVECYVNISFQSDTHGGFLIPPIGGAFTNLGRLLYFYPPIVKTIKCTRYSSWGDLFARDVTRSYTMAKPVVSTRNDLVYVKTGTTKVDEYWIVSSEAAPSGRTDAEVGCYLPANYASLYTSINEAREQIQYDGVYYNELDSGGKFICYIGGEFKSVTVTRTTDTVKINSPRNTDWTNDIYEYTLSKPEENTATSLQGHLGGLINMYINDWVMKCAAGKAVDLYDYGITIQNGFELRMFDEISFKSYKRLSYQTHLMPSVWRNTDGERRFYNAVNYGAGDTRPTAYIQGPEAGEVLSTATGTPRVDNPLYYASDDGKHLGFENEYDANAPKEHIETFDDIKPTIKGATNEVSGTMLPIDVVEEIAYDTNDNDAIWDNGEGSGQYQHPYFFVKLRPLGFNIFDLALQESMKLSFTTGHCGSCEFEIGVDEKTGKNPVQIYTEDDEIWQDVNGVLFRAHLEGQLKRYSTESIGYAADDRTQPIRATGLDDTYSQEEIDRGEVGVFRQAQKRHSEGDVMYTGKFIESQQDTTSNYVWIALRKDTETFGQLMPTTNLRPHSYTEEAESRGTTQPVEADTFVLTNIKLPFKYIRNAEERLSRAIVAYMADHNGNTYKYSVDLSRVKYHEEAESGGLLASVDENAKLCIEYNNKQIDQYVTNYNIEVKESEPLPQIKLDLEQHIIKPPSTTLELYAYAQRRERSRRVIARLMAERHVTANTIPIANTSLRETMYAESLRVAAEESTASRFGALDESLGDVVRGNHIGITDLGDGLPRLNKIGIVEVDTIRPEDFNVSAEGIILRKGLTFDDSSVERPIMRVGQIQRAGRIVRGIAFGSDNVDTFDEANNRIAGSVNAIPFGDLIELENASSSEAVPVRRLKIMDVAHNDDGSDTEVARYIELGDAIKYNPSDGSLTLRPRLSIDGSVVDTSISSETSILKLDTDGTLTVGNTQRRVPARSEVALRKDDKIVVGDSQYDIAALVANTETLRKGLRQMQYTYWAERTVGVDEDDVWLSVNDNRIIEVMGDSKNYFNFDSNDNWKTVESASDIE